MPVFSIFLITSLVSIRNITKSYQPQTSEQ